MKAEKADTRGLPVRETLKIRHYIMNLIYQHPGEVVMIPPSSELAAKFDVARSTVTLVLKELTEEGFLEGRRGVGTFTKHKNFIPLNDRMGSLIGLLAGDGKYFYYPHQVWSVMASCGMELTRSLCNVRPLTLTGVKDSEIFSELAHQHLDGLVWVDTSPARASLIRQMKDSGLKLVVQMTSHLDEECAGIDSFCFDYYKAGLELGKLLMDEERSRLFFIFENPLTASLLRGIRNAYDKGGKKLDVKSFDWARPAVFDEIETLIREERPDSIYIHGEHLIRMRKILDASGLDTLKSCRLIAEAHVLTQDFNGLVLDIPFEELGRRMAARMKELMQRPGDLPQNLRFPISVRHVK